MDSYNGALITEHLSKAQPMTPDALKTPENIARAARLLKRLHTIKRECRRYDPEAFAAQYLTAPALVLAAVDRRRATELRELARAYRTRYPSVVLCHNDLVASNVLDDGGLKLVDFEYAVTAAPVLDIAGLAALNDFDKDERWRLAEAYYDPVPVPFTAGELRKVVRLVRLIAYFWALSSAAAADEREPYSAFAERAAAALETIERS
jgi:thiamine kinase-like enzyme